MLMQINVSTAVNSVIDHYVLHHLMLLETMNNLLTYVKSLDPIDIGYIGYLLNFIKSDIEFRLDSHFFQLGKTRGFILTADMKFNQEAQTLDVYFDFIDSRNLVLPESNNVNSYKMN